MVSADGSNAQHGVFRDLSGDCEPNPPGISHDVLAFDPGWASALAIPGESAGGLVVRRLVRRTIRSGPLTISAKPVGVEAVSQPLIPTGEQSGLQTHIVTTESVSLCTRQQNGKVEMRGPFRL